MDMGHDEDIDVLLSLGLKPTGFNPTPKKRPDRERAKRV